MCIRDSFYDTGDGQLMAFWELHDDTIPSDHETSIAEGLGLLMWTNHIAFGADDQKALTVAKDRLLAEGIDVMEIDHNWCHSVYATDPNGIMVEFCTTTREFTQADKDAAKHALTSDDLADDEPPKIFMHSASAG